MCPHLCAQTQMPPSPHTQPPPCSDFGQLPSTRPLSKSNSKLWGPQAVILRRASGDCGGVWGPAADAPPTCAGHCGCGARVRPTSYTEGVMALDRRNERRRELIIEGTNSKCLGHARASLTEQGNQHCTSQDNTATPGHGHSETGHQTEPGKTKGQKRGKKILWRHRTAQLGR